VTDLSQSGAELAASPEVSLADTSLARGGLEAPLVSSPNSDEPTPTPIPFPEGNGRDDALAAGRRDLVLIASMVEPGSRVLDVGCGDGSLLALLRDWRGVDGRGIELTRDGVNACLGKGLSVIQGDADTDLADYPDDAFDYVILSQTLQATREPRAVLEHLLRIGRRAIVSFPNFGHWRVRAEIGLRGRMPMTPMLTHCWYDTPNIHFCTIRDFVSLCRKVGAHMERAAALDAAGQPVRFRLPWWVWNLFGEQAVFLLRREGRTQSLRTAVRNGQSGGPPSPMG
jgi:methionine biosynthesis protein MetW